jgi:hypothetical protein
LRSMVRTPVGEDMRRNPDREAISSRRFARWLRFC